VLTSNKRYSAAKLQNNAYSKDVNLEAGKLLFTRTLEGLCWSTLQVSSCNRASANFERSAPFKRQSIKPLPLAMNIVPLVNLAWVRQWLHWNALTRVGKRCGFSHCSSGTQNLGAKAFFPESGVTLKFSPISQQKITQTKAWLKLYLT